MALGLPSDRELLLHVREEVEREAKLNKNLRTAREEREKRRGKKGGGKDKDEE